MQKGYLPVQRLLCCSGLCCTSSPASKQVWLVLSPRFVCSEHYRVQGLLEEGRERAVWSFSGWKVTSHYLCFHFYFYFSPSSVDGTISVPTDLKNGLCSADSANCFAETLLKNRLCVYVKERQTLKNLG